MQIIIELEWNGPPESPEEAKRFRRYIRGQVKDGVEHSLRSFMRVRVVNVGNLLEGEG